MAEKALGVCQIKLTAPKDTNPRNPSWPGLACARCQLQGEDEGSALPLPCPGLDLGSVGDLLLLPDILLLLVVVELLDALVAAGLEQGGVGLQDQREITFHSFPGDAAPSSGLRADQTQLGSAAGSTTVQLLLGCVAINRGRLGKARQGLDPWGIHLGLCLPNLGLQR